MRPWESNISVDELGRVFFHHRRKMALFFLAAAVGTVAFVLFWPRAYRSEAKLFVRLGRENTTLDPTATLGQTPAVVVPQSREDEINSVIEVLKSRVLVEKVVDALGPQVILGHDDLPAAGQGPSSAAGAEVASAADTDTAQPSSEPATPAVMSSERYKAVLKLSKMVGMEAVKKSNIVLISCEARTPELSQAVVAKLVDSFLELHVRLNRTPRAQQFLSQQTERLHAQLRQTEKALEDAKNETGIVSLEGQRQTVVARVGRLQDDLLQANSSLTAARAEVQALRDKLAGLAKTEVTAQTQGFPNQALDAMRSQLYALELKEQELLTKHPEQHPEVRLIRQQTAAARELLTKEEKAREQTTSGPSRLYEETQLALVKQEPVVASLQAKVEALRQQLAHENSELKNFNGSSVRLSNLQRELDLEEANYRKSSEGLEQAQIDQALESEKISNINIVQPATYNLKPAWPRTLISLLVGFGLAVFGSIAVALAAEYLESPPKTAEYADGRLGLPGRVSIPTLTPQQAALSAGETTP